MQPSPLSDIAKYFPGIGDDPPKALDQARRVDYEKLVRDAISSLLVNVLKRFIGRKLWSIATIQLKTLARSCETLSIACHLLLFLFMLSFSSP